MSVLSVEYVHGRSGKRSYVDFMLQHGYVLHKDIHLHLPSMTLFVDDFIFVKRPPPAHISILDYLYQIISYYFTPIKNLFQN